MSDTDVNVPKSLQSSPKQQQPGPREKVVMDTLLKELKTLHTQLEEAIQGVACEVVQTMYNPAVSALNIDGTWTEIMADLPENLYGLVAIAVFNMLAGNILRAREQDLMLRALVTAWDIMKASKFIHSGHPKTEATTKSVLVLGILVLRIPSLAQTLGFSLTGPADGKTCFSLSFLGSSFSSHSGANH